LTEGLGTLDHLGGRYQESQDMQSRHVNVTVRFLGSLAERFGEQVHMRLRAPATVKDVLDALDIAESSVSLTIVDNTQVPSTAQLNDGASVLIVPPVIGG